jgi:hypothetical protein
MPARSLEPAGFFLSFDAIRQEKTAGPEGRGGFH